MKSWPVCSRQGQGWAGHCRRKFFRSDQRLWTSWQLSTGVCPASSRTCRPWPSTSCGSHLLGWDRERRCTWSRFRRGRWRRSPSSWWRPSGRGRDGVPGGGCLRPAQAARRATGSIKWAMINEDLSSGEFRFSCDSLCHNKLIAFVTLQWFDTENLKRNCMDRSNIPGE